MSSRYAVKLFINTLFLGGITALIVGAVYLLIQQGSFSMKEAIVSFGFGLLFGTMSQMAYFAYLSIHRFGLGFFRTPKMWNIVQGIILVLLFVNILFPQNIFKEVDVTQPKFIVQLILLVIVACLAAYYKSRQTKQNVFIPAIFFMIVATFVEWMPALKINNAEWMSFMLIPLLICNTYQLLILPKYLALSKMVRKNKPSVKGKPAAISQQ